jgi:ATP/maltotriose-dependent transcriptional regulator MalT
VGLDESAVDRPPVSVRAPQVARTFVQRERLDDLLDEATRRPLTLLVAPAGTGKTATLAYWARRSGAPRARWLDGRSLDAVHLGAELVRAAHGVGVVGAEVSDSAVVAALRASRRAPDVVVVDDAHLAGVDSWSLLNAVLDQVPDRIRVVLTSRRDVALPLVALALRDEVTVLRSDVLRFSPSEARDLVAAHAPAADDEDLDTLLRSAQGWAALLVLGARALGGAPNREAARAGLSRTEQPVLDYLLGEIFATLPAATRHVLLCTCVEDRVTDELAVVLSGDPDAGRRLDGLAMDGMLVTSYPGDVSGDESTGRVWEYHPLLRELLRRQVARDAPDHALAMAAHERAARHFADGDDVGAALEHATASGDTELVVALLVEHGPSLLTGGGVDVLSRALHSVPDDLRTAHPALLGVAALERRARGEHASALHLTDLTLVAAEGALARIAAAGDDPATAPPEVLALLTDAALLTAWQARFGLADPVRARETGEQILARHQLGIDVSEEPQGRRGWPMTPTRSAWLHHELAAVSMWLGDVEAARTHVAEMLVTSRAIGHDRLIAAGLANQAMLDMMDGRYQTASWNAEASLAAARKINSTGDMYIPRSLLAQAWAQYIAVEHEDASVTLTEVELMQQRLADPLVAGLTMVLRARLLAEAGDLTTARHMLATVRTVPGAMPPFLVWTLAMAEAELALVTGSMLEAQRQLEVQRSSGWSEGGAVLGAILTDLSGDATTALAQLQDILAEPPAPGLASLAACAAAYRTRILLRDGQETEGREALRDSLTRAYPERLLLPLASLATPDLNLEPMLRDLAAADPPHALAGEMLEAMARLPRSREPADGVPRPGGQEAGTATAGSTAQVPAQRVATGPLTRLTDREADVLRELALGGSYTDIAHALFVTENTVKTHLSAVYRKLGVAGRSPALREARARGLI